MQNEKKSSERETGGGGRGNGIKNFRNQEGFCARTDEEEEMRRGNEKEEGKKKEGGEREVIKKEAKNKEVEIERSGEETREKGMGDESELIDLLQKGLLLMRAAMMLQISKRR